jgi:hypothetical protein
VRTTSLAANCHPFEVSASERQALSLAVARSRSNAERALGAMVQMSGRGGLASESKYKYERLVQRSVQRSNRKEDKSTDQSKSECAALLAPPQTSPAPVSTAPPAPDAPTSLPDPPKPVAAVAPALTAASNPPTPSFAKNLPPAAAVLAIAAVAPRSPSATAASSADVPTAPEAPLAPSALPSNPVSLSGVARALHALAHVATAQGRFVEAVSLLQRAIRVLSTEMGDSHPEVANVLHSLGVAYEALGANAPPPATDAAAATPVPAAATASPLSVSIAQSSGAFIRAMGSAIVPTTGSASSLTTSPSELAIQAHAYCLLITRDCFHALHPDIATSAFRLARLLEAQPPAAQQRVLHDVRVGSSFTGVVTGIGAAGGVGAGTGVVGPSSLVQQAMVPLSASGLALASGRLPPSSPLKSSHSAPTPSTSTSTSTTSSSTDSAPASTSAARSATHPIQWITPSRTSSEAAPGPTALSPVESMYRYALMIRERALGDTHPLTLAVIGTLLLLFLPITCLSP